MGVDIKFYIVITVTILKIYQITPVLGLCTNNVNTSNPLTIFHMNGSVIDTAFRCRKVKREYPHLCSITAGSPFRKDGQPAVGGEGGMCCKTCCKNLLRSNPQVVEGTVYQSCRRLMKKYPALMCDMFGAPGGLCCKRCNKACKAGFNMMGSSFSKYDRSSLQNNLSASELQLTNYSISLSIRTMSPNGILLFVQSTTAAFLGAYMKDGLVFHSFNNNRNTVTAASTETYRDGRWHVVQLTKSNDHLQLCVDKECTSNFGETGNGHAQLKFDPYIYIGGVNFDDARYILNAHQIFGLTTGFRGCIANVTINGYAPSGLPDIQKNTRSCFLC